MLPGMFGKTSGFANNKAYEDLKIKEESLIWPEQQVLQVLL
jgi:hypothetical protein